MQHLKIAIRNIKKEPVFSAITFVGFMLGIMASVLIYLWVHNEISYDKMHDDYNRIYRVLTLSKQGDKITKSAGSYRPLTQSLKKDYPQIEAVTYVTYSSETDPLFTDDKQQKIEASRCWSGGDFFKIFTGFKFLEGNAETAFHDPSNVVLSEEVARKLFGQSPALGKSIYMDKYYKQVFTVGGVVRIPGNSHLSFDYMHSSQNPDVRGYDNDWSDKTFTRTYIKLAKNAVVTDDFLSNISNQVSRYSSFSDKLMFQPLADIHLYSDYETHGFDRNPGDIKYVYIFSGLAFLILLMAVFNFSVISVARASERSTEIGIKKVCGARKIDFARQFLGESVIQTFLAAVIGMVLLWLLLPFFNHFTGQNIQMAFSFRLVVSLLIVITLSGLLAGAYPTTFLSSLKPDRILKKGLISSSPNKLITVLVCVQFIIAIAFITSSSFFIKQINYVLGKDSGLNHENIIVVPTGLWYSNQAFKDELRKNPHILEVSAGGAPVNFNWATNLPLQGSNDSIRASMLWVDEDFAKTYDLEVLQGHFLDMDFSQYWNQWKKKTTTSDKWNLYSFHAVSFPVVINQQAEKALNIEDPIGKRLGNFVIVGVVKDFNFRSAYHPIEPLLLTCDPQSILTMNIKISAEDKVETIKYIQSVYRKFRGEREFSFQFFDDMLTQIYQQEIFMRNITLLFTGIAIIISVLGVLGISLFSIKRRTKEIGIRKVNGAKVGEILALLNKDFIKWVAIAFVIATPIAWYAINKWLENFAYKTELSWWVFALAGVLALGIALLTVSWQSWRAATRNPVEALRYE